jgi:leucine dehydrogenase
MRNFGGIAAEFPRLDIVRDEASGLFAAIAVDRRIDGIAAGGIRIRRYPADEAAAADAAALARAMSLKAALAGIRCGGAKVAVRADRLRDRAAALEALGREIEARGGALRVGPDLGFTEADRTAVARATRYIDDPTVAGRTAEATAASVRDCLAAALGAERLAGARIGIQGLGKVGAALARLLLAEGADVVGHDIELGRVEAAGVRPVGERDLFEARLDGLAPCAVGGTIDLERARGLRCRAVVGAANCLLAAPEAEVARALAARGVVHVPDFLANAGALVYWAEVVLAGRGEEEAARAVKRIGKTARRVLVQADAEKRTPFDMALAIAEKRLRRNEEGRGETGTKRREGA